MITPVNPPHDRPWVRIVTLGPSSSSTVAVLAAAAVVTAASLAGYSSRSTGQDRRWRAAIPRGKELEEEVDNGGHLFLGVNDKRVENNKGRRGRCGSTAKSCAWLHPCCG